jgi:5-methyltetrahydrofolate--homocysteine methyltransferase
MLYTLSVDDYVQAMKDFITQEGVQIVGGCCGTTPEHIKAIADVVKDYEPRSLSLSVIC